MNKLKTLVIGHTEKAYHDALAEYFDLVFIIADTKNANLNWHDLANLKIPLNAPTETALNDSTFINIIKKYQRFTDINQRRYIGVNEHEGEVFNSFTLTFYWAYKLLKDKDIEIIIMQNFPHEGFDYIFYLIAKEIGIKVIATHQLSVVGNRFWISDDINNFGSFKDSPDLYEMEVSNYQLPDTFFYMKPEFEKLHFNHNYEYSFLKFVKELVTKPARFPVIFLRYYHHYIFMKNKKSMTKTFNFEKKFVYVPLQLQPELTLSSMGGEDMRYSDQLQMIEQLRLFIPEDISIILKENPKQTAKQRGPLFYKRVSLLKNVQFVDINISSRGLINSCIGIATVTGTVGWEGAFYQKPVLVFGNAWYGEMPGITKFRTTLSFEEWISTKKFHKEHITKELDKLVMKTGKGIVDPDYIHLVNNFDLNKSASSYAESIVRYVEITNK